VLETARWSGFWLNLTRGQPHRRACGAIRFRRWLRARSGRRDRADEHLDEAGLTADVAAIEDRNGVLAETDLARLSSSVAIAVIKATSLGLW
jgi:hypothetical protein